MSCFSCAVTTAAATAHPTVDAKYKGGFNMCCNNLCNIIKSDCFWIIVILLFLWGGCSDNGCGCGRGRITRSLQGGVKTKVSTPPCDNLINITVLRFEFILNPLFRFLIFQKLFFCEKSYFSHSPKAPKMFYSIRSAQKQDHIQSRRCRAAFL